MIRPRLATLHTRLGRLLASRRFFIASLAVFGLGAGWIALTSLYPMAFDEEVHVGTIKLYSELSQPFAVQQTAEANDFGSIVTDPSYLYHYLMSFPYRLITALTDSQFVLVFVLRLLNIGLVLFGFVLMRRFLLRVGFSAKLTHTALAFTMLIPVMPLLAAQVNYDNLVIVLVPLLGLVAWRLRQQLRMGEALRSTDLAYLVAFVLYGSVVKYAFLPIAFGACLYLVYEYIRALRLGAKPFAGAARLFRSLRPLVRVLLILLVLGGLLFAGQRYGTNLVRYHALVPDCGQVLTTEQCLEWGPWGRDYWYAKSVSGDPAHNPVQYTIFDWVPGMYNRLFFAVSGPTLDYQTRERLPLPAVGFAILFVAGMVLTLLYARRLYRQYPAVLLIVALSVPYVLALWFQVYQDYLHTHVAVAINGRYLLPLLPLWFVVFGAAFAYGLRALRLSPYAATIAVTLLVIVVCAGGGATTYFVRAYDSWFYEGWPQSANRELRELLQPLIYGAGEN